MLVVFGFAGLDYLIRRGKYWNLPQRSQWLKKWSSTLVSGMGFDIHVIGTPPEKGFVAPNHQSYMDILVLSSVTNLNFLSKSEVRKWPLIGKYTEMAGTVFIDRSRKRDVANKNDAFGRAIDESVSLTIFLEGTSTNGEEVLSYRSSLLQPMVENDWPITPVYIKYDCVGGSVADEVCWWGDAEFTPHLVNMLALPRVSATIVFGEMRTVGGRDRKELAVELREDVLRLRKQVES
ncbi:1-acyl-sn-glycerol-3-phosphate acyltransferase [Puniceicoccaceae bacterium K14]|nr:1-acyl-sn-glycerol-3-phosphate acyltransferase [Puniceicoccaceae bacterium K14]